MTEQEHEIAELIENYADHKKRFNDDEFWYGKLHAVFGIDKQSKTLSYKAGYEAGEIEGIGKCLAT